VVPGGEGVGGAKKKDKEYELSSTDEFWMKHKGSPFPQVRSQDDCYLQYERLLKITLRTRTLTKLQK